MSDALIDFDRHADSNGWITAAKAGIADSNLNNIEKFLTSLDGHPDRNGRIACAKDYIALLNGYPDQDLEGFIAILKKFLSLDYQPPKNYHTLTNHLFALFIFYRLLSKRQLNSFTTTFRIDQAALKLIGGTTFRMLFLFEKQKKINSTQNSTLTRGKSKNNAKEVTLKICKALDIERPSWKDRRSKTAIYDVIIEELLERYDIKRKKTAISGYVNEFIKKGEFTL